MIVALEEAKRKLVALEDVLAELKNQLRIDEAKERAEELERETMVQNFWDDAEKSSKIMADGSRATKDSGAKRQVEPCRNQPELPQIRHCN